VGWEFLGRYQGRLEFSPTQGWLEIQGQKAALIDKRAALRSDAVTDECLLKVLRQPTLQGYSVPEMVLEGAIHHLGGDEYRNIPVVSRGAAEIPTGTMRIVPFSSKGAIPMGAVAGKSLVIEPVEVPEEGCVVLPGVGSVVGHVGYCLVANLTPRPTEIQGGRPRGRVSVVDIDPPSPDPDEGQLNQVQAGWSDKENRKFLEEKLKLGTLPFGRRCCRCSS